MKRQTILLALSMLLGATLWVAPTRAHADSSSSDKRIHFTDGKFGEAKTRLPSGLGYRILREGKGEGVRSGATVSVHYTGYFKNGKIFDSSVRRNEPFEFHLGAGEVIDGWDQGVLGMKKGERRLLFVPSKLAYGSRGQGEIPPNTDLYFEVELLSASD